MIMVVAVSEGFIDFTAATVERKVKFFDDLLNDQKNDVKTFISFFSTASEQAKWNLIFGAAPYDTNFKVSLANSIKDKNYTFVEFVSFCKIRLELYRAGY